MENMDNDVAMFKGLFMETVGPDWQSVCARSTWQNSQPACPQLIDSRGVTPWDEVHNVMTRRGDDSVSAFIARTARRLTCNYYVWQN